MPLPSEGPGYQRWPMLSLVPGVTLGPPALGVLFVILTKASSGRQHPQFRRSERGAVRLAGQAAGG